MVSVAVNGGFALLHSPGCIPGGFRGRRLAPDEREPPPLSLRRARRDDSYRDKTRCPSITPLGEAGVTAGARTDVAGINRAGGGGRKCWDGKDRCGGLF